MTTITGGTKFDAWVAQARELGLDVTVEVNSNDTVLQSVSAFIRRPRVEERNMLDAYRNSETLSLHACRSCGGRWTNSARRWSHGTRGGIVTLKLRSVAYWLTGMTD